MVQSQATEQVRIGSWRHLNHAARRASGMPPIPFSPMALDPIEDEDEDEDQDEDQDQRPFGVPLHCYS